MRERRHRRRAPADARRGAAVRRARPEAGRVPADPRDPRPPPDRRRAGHVLGHVERALLVQVEQGAPAPVRRQDHGRRCGEAAGRHRRERGRGRHRRRLGGHVQGRDAQPPVLRRAVPGRGDRRRRHRARHHGDGRPPDRGDGPAAVRRGRPPRHRPRGARRRCRRRRLRQLPRPAEHRRRGRLRRLLPGQPAGQRALRRRRCGTRTSTWPTPPARATRSSCSARGPAATASAGVSVLASETFDDDRPGQAPGGAGRRPVHREGAHRVLPRALRRPRGRGHPGPRRRRAVLRDQRARVQPATAACTSGWTGCRCATPRWRPRRS